MPFNIGPGEIILVLIIALIVVGPGKLPDVGSALGKSIREFRKAATDVKESTSLDTSATVSSASPREVSAPAPTALPPTPPVSAAVTTPPAPIAAVPGAVATAAATPDLPPPPAVAETAAAAVEPADAPEWPAEVTPADEQQQRTASV